MIEDNNISIEKKIVNMSMAQHLFKLLISGSVVNKQILDPKAQVLVPNPYFVELLDHESTYKTNYEMMGYDLLNAGDYFHLADVNSSIDDKQLTKTKVYASLIMLVRFITQEQRMLYNLILDVKYGVSSDDLNKMNELDDYRQILNSSKLNNADEMIKLLLKRGFIYQLNSGKFILSSSGRVIVSDIAESHSD